MYEIESIFLNHAVLLYDKFQVSELLEFIDQLQ